MSTISSSDLYKYRDTLLDAVKSRKERFINLIDNEYAHEYLEDWKKSQQLLDFFERQFEDYFRTDRELQFRTVFL